MSVDEPPAKRTKLTPLSTPNGDGPDFSAFLDTIEDALPADLLQPPSAEVVISSNGSIESETFFGDIDILTNEESNSPLDSLASDVVCSSSPLQADGSPSVAADTAFSASASVSPPTDELAQRGVSSPLPGPSTVTASPTPHTPPSLPESTSGTATPSTESLTATDRPVAEEARAGGASGAYVGSSPAYRLQHRTGQCSKAPDSNQLALLDTSGHHNTREMGLSLPSVKEDDWNFPMFDLAPSAVLAGMDSGQVAMSPGGGGLAMQSMPSPPVYPMPSDGDPVQPMANSPFSLSHNGSPLSAALSAGHPAMAAMVQNTPVSAVSSVASVPPSARSPMPGAVPPGPSTTTPGATYSSAAAVPGNPSSSVAAMSGVSHSSVAALSGIPLSSAAALPGVLPSSAAAMSVSLFHSAAGMLGVPSSSAAASPGSPRSSVARPPGVPSSSVTAMSGAPLTSVAALSRAPLSSVAASPGASLSPVAGLPGVPFSSVSTMQGVPLSPVTTMPGVPASPVGPTPGISSRNGVSAHHAASMSGVLPQHGTPTPSGIPQMHGNQTPGGVPHVQSALPPGSAPAHHHHHSTPAPSGVPPHSGAPISGSAPPYHGTPMPGGVPPPLGAPGPGGVFSGHGSPMFGVVPSRYGSPTPGGSLPGHGTPVPSSVPPHHGTPTGRSGMPYNGMNGMNPSPLMNGLNPANQMSMNFGHPGAAQAQPNAAAHQSLATSAADPEKRALIQHQLVLLLHAHKCIQREQQGLATNCNLPHCRTMKSVLAHMTHCQAGKTCPVAHCSSSRQILLHWKSCNRSDCAVCNSVRNDVSLYGGQNGGNNFMGQPQQPPTNINGQTPQSYHPGVTDHLARTTTDPTKRKQYQHQLILLLHAHKCQQREQQGLENNCKLPHCQTMKNVLAHLAHCQAGKSCPTPLCTTSREVLQHWKNTNQSESPPSYPTGNDVSQYGGHGLAQSLSGQTQQLPMNLCRPLMSRSTQPWHAGVTEDLRSHLVRKLVTAIFPSSAMADALAVHDPRLQNFVQFACRVERDMFEAAPSRDEYYHKLAEKIYKIQKDLEDKKAKRLSDMIQQQAQVMMTGTVPAGQQLAMGMPQPPQNGMPPNGMPPNGMPPNGMPPNGMPPNGMPPNGMPPNGMPPNGMPPNGMPPNGMPPNGMPPNGMQPNGMPPNGMPPNAMPPNGMLLNGMTGMPHSNAIPQSNLQLSQTNSQMASMPMAAGSGYASASHPLQMQSGLGGVAGRTGDGVMPSHHPPSGVEMPLGNMSNAMPSFSSMGMSSGSMSVNSSAFNQQVSDSSFLANMMGIGSAGADGVPPTLPDVAGALSSATALPNAMGSALPAATGLSDNLRTQLTRKLVYSPNM